MNKYFELLAKARADGLEKFSYTNKVGQTNTYKRGPNPAGDHLPDVYSKVNE